VKDGAQVNQDREKCYVFMRATDEFAVFAREKLKALVGADGKELAVESKQEVVAAIAKVIEEEENNAELGFGAIFG
jgi:tellurite resistance protein